MIAINVMRLQKGLALQDILGAIYEALQELELAAQTRISIKYRGNRTNSSQCNGGRD